MARFAASARKDGGGSPFQDMTWSWDQSVFCPFHKEEPISLPAQGPCKQGIPENGSDGGATYKGMANRIGDHRV